MIDGVMPKLEYPNPPEYDRYEKYRTYLRTVSNFSCTYCTISESESLGATFNIEHFRPKAKFPLLECKCENLRYACPRCNSYKRNLWIEKNDGCIQDCEKCTRKVCKNNIARFIDSLKELPAQHIYLDEDDFLHAYTGSNPANYTIKYLRLNRAQLVKLRHVRRFMDNWLNDLNIEREQASKRLEEIKAKQQAFSTLSKVQGSDRSDVHSNMITTMYEMMVLHAEQAILLIDQEIQRLNYILQQRSGCDATMNNAND